MQPIIEYATTILDHLAGRYRETIAGLPDEALGWRPGDERTNSLARIIRHVVLGQRLILGMALGTPPTLPLDERARGFHDDSATADELLGLLDRMARERVEALAALDRLDLTETVTRPPGPARTRFFFVAHAVGEAREHLGHAELTRQLWDRRGADGAH